MTTSQWVLAGGLAAIGLAVLTALGSLGVFAPQRREVVRTLDLAGQMHVGSAATGPMRPKTSAAKLLGGSLATGLIKLTARLSPSTLGEQLQQRLDTAGNPGMWTVERIMAAKGFGLLIGALLGVAYGHSSLALMLLLACALGAVGFYLPNVLLYNAGLKRQLSVRETIADTIDLLVVCVQAGLSFDAGMSQVARRSTGPLGGEFSRVLQEMQIGKSRAEAITGFGERVNVPEARNFAHAVVQADALGIPVARVLQEQAKELRIKKRQLAEEQAQKLPVKILFPMLFLIFPALLVLVAGPAAINVSHIFR
jgi:tight adherence protein C